MKLTNGIHHIPHVHAETDKKPASNADPTIRSGATTAPEIKPRPKDPSRRQGLHPTQRALVKKVQAQQKGPASPNQNGGSGTVGSNSALEAAAAGLASAATSLAKYASKNSCPRGKVIGNAYGVVVGAATSIITKSNLQEMQDPKYKVPKEIHTDPYNTAASLAVSALAQKHRGLGNTLSKMTRSGLIANTGVGMAGGAVGGATNALIYEKNRTAQVAEKTASLIPETDNPPTKNEIKSETELEDAMSALENQQTQPTKGQLVVGSVSSKVLEFSVQKWKIVSSTAGVPVPSVLLPVAKMSGAFLKAPLTPRTPLPMQAEQETPKIQSD